MSLPLGFTQSPNPDRLGIDHLSVFGLPPVPFVQLAANLRCRYISTGFTPPRFNPHGFPKWSLREDANLRREMIAAMKDCGVSIALGDGFGVMPNSDVRDSAGDLALMRELGASCINAVVVEPDLERSFDQLAVIAEMAEAAGLATVLEFAPGSTIGDLSTALAAVRHVGRKNFRLLIDTMHLVRSGSTAAQLASMDPELIGYVQLCDVPLVSQHSEYIREARYERLVPGAGELPLLDLLTVLPRDVVIGLEVPQRTLAESGIGPQERMTGCVRAARSLLDQLPSRS